MQENPYQPGNVPSSSHSPPSSPSRDGLSGFDKFCAGSAFVLGIVFLMLGAIGLFAGCSAHFTLPPVVGVVPAFVGWGIVRAVRVAWNTPVVVDRLSCDAPTEPWGN